MGLCDTPGVTAHPLTTKRDFITEFFANHGLFGLFHHIQVVADTNSVPRYENDLNLTTSENGRERYGEQRLHYRGTS